MTDPRLLSKKGWVLASALFLFLGTAAAEEAEIERVPPLSTKLYRESCGECHFAYFPGLLPASDWRRLMQPKALADHFGENAELDEEDRRAILAWLVANAAPEGPAFRSWSTPPRISTTPWFASEHRSALRALRESQETKRQVRTIANCAACHPAIDRGNFELARIPGKRRSFWRFWEHEEEEEEEGYERD